ncbi:hypothetical protein ACX0HA_11500 [Flavobacterium hauense]
MVFNFFSKKVDIKKVFEESENILSRLITLKNLLEKGNHSGQAKFIEQLIILLQSNKIESIPIFIKLIQGVDMWGGAGAVWEVYFEKEDLEKSFIREMIQLTNLMDKARISNTRIKDLMKVLTSI